MHRKNSEAEMKLSRLKDFILIKWSQKEFPSFQTFMRGPSAQKTTQFSLILSFKYLKLSAFKTAIHREITLETSHGVIVRWILPVLMSEDKKRSELNLQN